MRKFVGLAASSMGLAVVVVYVVSANLEDVTDVCRCKIPGGCDLFLYFKTVGKKTTQIMLSSEKANHRDAI